MAKGFKYNKHTHLFRALISSGVLWMTFLFVLTCLISVADIVFNCLIIFGKSDASLKDWSDLAFAVISFIVTFYGAFKSGKKLYGDYFKRQIIEENSLKTDIIKNVTSTVDGKHIGCGYAWREFNNGEEQFYLQSDEVDLFLYSNVSELKIKVIRGKQKLNSDQKNALCKIVKQKIEQGKNIFNSSLVRLKTDMLYKEIKEGKELKKVFANKYVTVQKTDYFSNLATNDQIYMQMFKSDFSSVYNGKDSTLHKNCGLYNLSESPAANIIGATTLAVTKDGKFIINSQNDSRNDVNNGCLVPSGSGSADFEDLVIRADGEGVKKARKAYKSAKKQFELKQKELQNLLIANTVNIDNILAPENEDYKDYLNLKTQKEKLYEEYKYLKSMRRRKTGFADFITYAMERELMEESHLKKEHIIKTCVCGYIRILDRGGKPDFFGITFLNCNEEEADKKFRQGKAEYTVKELKKNRPITDFNEVSSQVYADAEDVMSSRTDENVFVDKKISLQLNCLLNIIRKNELLKEEIRRHCNKK